MNCPQSLVIKTSNNLISDCCKRKEASPSATAALQAGAPKGPTPYYIELTVTLKPYMYSKCLDDQVKLTKDRLLSVLHGFNKSIVIELTSQYNIHYHCLLTEKKPSQEPFLRITDRLRSERWAGRRTIQGVQYYESYIKYMNKEISRTNKIIKSSSIVKDDFNILGFQWEESPKRGAVCDNSNGNDFNDS